MFTTISFIYSKIIVVVVVVIIIIVTTTATTDANYSAKYPISFDKVGSGNL